MLKYTKYKCHIFPLFYYVEEKIIFQLHINVNYFPASDVFLVKDKALEVKDAKEFPGKKITSSLTKVFLGKGKIQKSFLPGKWKIDYFLASVRSKRLLCKENNQFTDKSAMAYFLARGRQRKAPDSATESS